MATLPIDRYVIHHVARDGFRQTLLLVAGLPGLERAVAVWQLLQRERRLLSGLVIRCLARERPGLVDTRRPCQTRSAIDLDAVGEAFAEKVLNFLDDRGHRPGLRERLGIPRLVICSAKVAPGLSGSIFCMEADDEPVSEVCNLATASRSNRG